MLAFFHQSSPRASGTLFWRVYPDDLLKTHGAREMFHRTTNGPDLSKKVPDYAEPEQQTFAYQSKVIEQSAVERYARNEAVQAAVSQQTANQSQPLTQNQFYVYESPIYEE
jgi:hypothetical protein